MFNRRNFLKVVGAAAVGVSAPATAYSHIPTSVYARRCEFIIDYLRMELSGATDYVKGFQLFTPKLATQVLKWLDAPGAHDHFFRIYEHCRHKERMSLEDVKVPKVYIEPVVGYSLITFQPREIDKSLETIAGIANISESGVRLLTTQRNHGCEINEWASCYSDQYVDRPP